MKQSIIILLAIILIASSCSAPSDTTVKFRAHPAWYSETSNAYIAKSQIEILTIDSSYRSGDTIELNSKTYFLTERVK